MTPIYKGGNANPDRIFKGQHELFKVYKGMDLVWQKTPKEVDPGCDSFLADISYLHLYKTDVIPPVDIAGSGSTDILEENGAQVSLVAPPHQSCQGAIEFKQGAYQHSDGPGVVPYAKVGIDTAFSGGEWSFAFWFRAEEHDHFQRVLTGPTDDAICMEVAVRPNRLVETGWRITGLATGAYLSESYLGVGNWVRVAVAVKIYEEAGNTYITYKSSINGIVSHQNPTDITGRAVSKAHWFGGSYYRGSTIFYDYRFEGAISDVKIWDREISDFEMECDYHAGTCYGYDLDFDADADI